MCAFYMGKAPAQQAAVQKTIELFSYELGQYSVPLEAALDGRVECRKVLTNHPVQRRPLGPTSRILERLAALGHPARVAHGAPLPVSCTCAHLRPSSPGPATFIADMATCPSGEARMASILPPNGAEVVSPESSRHYEACYGFGPHRGRRASRASRERADVHNGRLLGQRR